MLFSIIPFTRDWNTQRNIDSFIRAFIISTFSFESPECVPQDLEDFLGRIGDQKKILDFLSTPYHRNKAPAYSGQTPFQMIVGNLPWNYIPAARAALNADGLWGCLVRMQLPKTRLFLNSSDLANRLDLTLKDLPEVTRQMMVRELLMRAVRINHEPSIPALRHALFEDEDADQAKWASALIKDRYIFTALAADASSTIIKALVNGLTPAEYREVMMAVDPENGTDPIPLIMQVMLSEDWSVKRVIADHFEESDWENLLTGNWSERFITNVTEDEKADELLSFILEYLSDDCILRVAQANECFLLKQIVCSEDYDLYATLLNNIKDQNIQERVFSLIKEIAKNAENIFYYADDSNRTGSAISVPAFILRDTYNSAAGKAEEVEAPEDLRCTYTHLEDLHFACFEDLAGPAP